MNKNNVYQNYVYNWLPDKKSNMSKKMLFQFETTNNPHVIHAQSVSLFLLQNCLQLGPLVPWCWWLPPTKKSNRSTVENSSIIRIPPVIWTVSYYVILTKSTMAEWGDSNWSSGFIVVNEAFIFQLRKLAQAQTSKYYTFVTTYLPVYTIKYLNLVPLSVTSPRHSTRNPPIITNCNEKNEHKLKTNLIKLSVAKRCPDMVNIMKPLVNYYVSNTNYWNAHTHTHEAWSHRKSIKIYS